MITQHRSVCVFCGAGGKMPDEYKQVAYDLGHALAVEGFTLVTGGANVGMMKEVVDGHAKFSPTGIRHGVLPEIFKEYNINHPFIPSETMQWPNDLHTRLKTFYKLAQDVVVMPGGFGTLHELMDCLVHSQFGLISKRLYLLNMDNFWDSILQQFKVMVQQNAVQQKHVDHLIVVSSVPELIEHLSVVTEPQLIQGLEADRWERQS